MPQPRILVVDDEWLLCWALQKRLERSGYQVLLAGTGEQALEFLARDVQLVLLDVQLPDANGVTLLKDVKKRCPECHVIMMTAKAGPEIAAEATAHGADCLIEKPFELQKMVQMVDDLLHMKQAG
jgi:DNA-binding NtrC family response regulator